MKVAVTALAYAVAAFSPQGALAQPTADPDAAPAAPKLAVPSPNPMPAAATAILPQGTPLKVILNVELSTVKNKTGDTFDVTVLEDVVQDGTIVIPKGAIGHGELIFAANRGGFGKAGMLYLALRRLDLGDKSYLLDGRFREEGKDSNGATAATYFAVGVFAGFIKGKPGAIGKGRELQARTGEPITYVPGAAPPPVPAVTGVDVTAATSTTSPTAPDAPTAEPTDAVKPAPSVNPKK